jgi:6-phosphogluconolactonase
MKSVEMLMKIDVFPDATAVARQAAAIIAEEARAAVVARDRFVLAVSGGKTPWLMLRALGSEKVPWEKVHILQVDERVAPAGHADRNYTHLRESLLERVRLRGETGNGATIYPMPVESPDLEIAAKTYARTLLEIAGDPPVIDLVHLGLGPDGHTASLVPGDPVLDIKDTDVALTQIYQGRRRMTLTYTVINRCRRILWLVTGPDKAGPLERLRKADRSIPAGRVRQDHAIVLADKEAAAGLKPS